MDKRLSLSWQFLQNWMNKQIFYKKWADKQLNLSIKFDLQEVEIYW